MKMNYRELYERVRYAGMSTMTKMYAYALLYDDIMCEKLLDMETDSIIEGLYSYYMDNKLPHLTMQQIVDSYLCTEQDKRVPLKEVAHMTIREQWTFWGELVARYISNDYLNME